MKTQDKIITLAASAAFVGLAIYFLDRTYKVKKLKKVADEGYETAHDILYPSARLKKEKLIFGPILPE